MKTLCALLAVCGSVLMAQARLVPLCPPFQEMFEKSDLIAIALPVSTNDTPEKTVLSNTSPAINVIGVETTFVVQTLIKSETATNRFVLHHYRLAENKLYMNGPVLLSFDPGKQKSFLLFLKKEADGRFAPIYNQTDPGMCGTYPAESIDLIAIARPISAKEHLSDGVIPNITPPESQSEYQTEFAVQKLLKGEDKAKRFTLHYYEHNKPAGLSFNPFKNFDPDPGKVYLLFLKKEATGHFAPSFETPTEGISVIRLGNEDPVLK